MWISGAAGIVRSIMRDTETKLPITQQAVDEPTAATYAGYTGEAFRKWRREGRGPAFIRVNRSIRYRVSDLDTWLDRHRIETREMRGT